MAKKFEKEEGLDPEINPQDAPYDQDLVEIEIIKKAKGLKVGERFIEHKSTADALVLKDIAKIV